MWVKLVDGNYEFTCHTVEGEFIVKMILFKNGEEMLNTQPADCPEVFPSRKLESGTIERAIGKERWNNFQRMRDKGYDAMFIDEHKEGFIRGCS